MSWQWVWWFCGALVLGAVEMLTVEFTFLMLAVGSIAAGIAALIGALWWGSAIVFAVVTLVLLVSLRPMLINRLHRKAEGDPITGTAALVGRIGEAVTGIDSIGGRAKIDGEVWTARVEAADSISKGGRVKVVAIDGATAVVEPTV
ncbi:MAG: NfeD family protein [Micrococcales bacterium]|nr:NfeD family protein [Micrococcales bacterium]